MVHKLLDTHIPSIMHDGGVLKHLARTHRFSAKMGFEKFASPPPIARITWPVSGQKITQKTNGKNRIRQAEAELYQAQTCY